MHFDIATLDMECEICTLHPTAERLKTVFDKVISSVPCGKDMQSHDIYLVTDDFK
jgi:hypothetical protein